MTIIIILGAPGSGKGTQASRISRELNLPHISTGDLFRENLKNKTLLGEKIRTLMDSGKLVPDDLVLEMLFSRLSEEDCKGGFMLDGFPRTIPQAEAFEKFLTGKCKEYVLNLVCKDESVIKRISGRLTCNCCGAIYNKYFSPPKEDGICDRCKSALMQRPDDLENVVKERLNVYKEQTEPLVKFYEERNHLVNLDGEQEPEAVYEAIMKAIKA